MNGVRISGSHSRQHPGTRRILPAGWIIRAEVSTKSVFLVQFALGSCTVVVGWIHVQNGYTR